MRLCLVASAALGCSLLVGACRCGAELYTTSAGNGDAGWGSGSSSDGSESGNPTGGSESGNPSGGSESGNGGAGGGPAAGGDSAAGAGSAVGGAAAGGSAAAGGDGGAGTGTAAGGGDESYLVFASTDTTLFGLDPTAPNLPLTKVGVFNCIDPVNGPYTAMVDIAVDRFQHLWGITGHAVFPLIAAGGTVHCGGEISLINPEPGQQVPTFYALTFAPLGVLDPLKEVLVAGNTAGELWAIDAASNLAKHGVFGQVPEDDGNGHPYASAHVGKPWELSGDLVFLANGDKPVGFATVRDCPDPPSPAGCSKTDTLLEIDMVKLSMANPGVVTKAVRGKILKEINCNGIDGLVSGSMFGIAAWNDKVFGFSRSGSLVSIGTSDASGCLLKNYPQEKFSGAGVTTLAPIVVPPLQ